jgi:hypothetical protein
LHWFRALAAKEGVQIKRHWGRKGEKDTEKRALENVPLFIQFAPPFEWYRESKDASQAARDEVVQYFYTDFQNLWRNSYEPFREFVTSHLDP